MTAGFIRVAAAESSDSLRAFYDAIALKQYVQADTFLTADKTKKAIISGYFRKYLPDSLQVRDSIAETILAYIKKTNPFLSPMIRTDTSKLRTDLESAPLMASSPAQQVLGSLAGLDVTNIAQGVTEFMVQRAKDELDIAFFDRLKDYFGGHKEVALLFPQTSNILLSLEAYRYTEVLPVLRAAFLSDLKTWPQNLDSAVAVDTTIMKSSPELRLLTQTIRIVYRLQAGQISPAEMLKEFSGFETWSNSNLTPEFKNMGNSFKLANIFSQSLMDTESGFWITQTQLKGIVDDSIAFRLYLGLVYQEVKNYGIAFIRKMTPPAKDTVLFSTLMSTNAATVLKIQSMIQELIGNSSRFASLYREIKAERDSGKALSENDYLKYVNAGIDIAQQYLDIAAKMGSGFYYEDWIQLARQGVNVCTLIYDKEYGQAIISGTNILSSELKTIENTTSDRKLKKAAQQLCETMSTITKYSLFMVNVVEAKSADDVKNAIDAAALPVGSSAIKKNSSFDFCLQGYLGAYYGGRGVKNSELDNNSWNDHFGVTAPIGVSLSTELWDWGASLSIFVSLFDIGAIVDYDLKTQISPLDSSVTIQKDYKVELGNVFTPGLYLVLGFPLNLPLSLGVGGQYGPGLGTITSNGKAIINNPTLRWNVFLAVDIPFFEFVNYPRN